MEIRGTIIEDTFAEAFRMWAARLIVTAIDEHWVRIAAQEVTGYGTSVIGCDAEAGVERYWPATQTPDGRPGVSILFFAFNAEKLGKALVNRTGQCLMTCPTTAVYDGLPGVVKSDDTARVPLGDRLRFFGDGNQKSKRVETEYGPRRYWRIPVMDGEFLCEDSAGAMKAIGGGNFLVCGTDQKTALDATRRAVAAIGEMDHVITPFPGGIVRSGSKVGSRYKGMFASTNDEYCPTLRSRAPRGTKLREGVRAVYEVVINGLAREVIAVAMSEGIEAAAGPGIVAISAGNYGGNLGKFHFLLREVVETSQLGKAIAADILAGKSPALPAASPPGESADSAVPPAADEPRSYVLRWRNRDGVTLTDGSDLRPDRLSRMDPRQVATLPLRVGREIVPLRDLFDIEEAQTRARGARVELVNAPPLDRLGEAMASGQLVVHGPVGDDLGASMSGGEILIHGSAGHRVGGPSVARNRGMSNGTITVRGDAGDYVGLRMRRGTIAVHGKAGRSPGYRMLAGTIAIGRGPYDEPGLEMRRGTLLLLDRRASALDTPAFREEGLIDAQAFPIVSLMRRQLAAFGLDSEMPSEADRFRLYSGDRFELNKGEIWQWVS